MSSSSPIVVTTVVAANPDAAFGMFTQEVDLWWKRGPKFRPSISGVGVLRFEPGVGGRLLEIYADDSSFEFGRIKVWDVGRRLVFELLGRDFQQGDSTEVEVRFESDPQGTRVTVEHRGWERFPDNHPARHGLAEPAFTETIRAWWADLLVAIRQHAQPASADGR